MAFWIRSNVANRTNFHEENFWTFNSQPALLIHFPYWSLQTLKTTIKICVDNDLISIGNFNKKKYDKTSWYSLTEKGLNLFPCLKDELIKGVNEKNSNKINIGENQPMDKLKLTDGQVKINRPIPDNKPDNKQDRERGAERKKRVPLSENFEPDEKSKAAAEQKGLDLARVLSKFRAHAKSEGWVRVDWQEAFMKWVIDEKIEKKMSYLYNNKIINEPVRPKMRDFTQERLDREDAQRSKSHGSDRVGCKGMQKVESYLF